MLFGMLDPTNFRHGPSLGETMTVRSVFIISPLKRVELILSYPAYVGRNFDEILRVLDALQLSAKYRVATPANWRPGDDTVVLPFISDEEAERMFAEQGGFARCGPTWAGRARDPSLEDPVRARASAKRGRAGAPRWTAGALDGHLFTIGGRARSAANDPRGSDPVCRASCHPPQ